MNESKRKSTNKRSDGRMNRSSHLEYSWFLFSLSSSFIFAALSVIPFSNLFVSWLSVSAKAFVASISQSMEMIEKKYLYTTYSSVGISICFWVGFSCWNAFAESTLQDLAYPLSQFMSSFSSFSFSLAVCVIHELKVYNSVWISHFNCFVCAISAKSFILNLCRKRIGLQLLAVKKQVIFVAFGLLLAVV